MVKAIFSFMLNKLTQNSMEGFLNMSPKNALPETD